MPKSRVNLSFIIDHPEKSSSNVLNGADWGRVMRSLILSLGGDVSIESAMAVPDEISAKSDFEEYPA